MSRMPFLKLYKTDWLHEPTLRLCSRAARSLWLDMLCLMHDATPCGHLTLKGKPLDARSLAVVLGDRESDVVAWLAELESNGVFSRNRRGVIFSRRMVRDAARAEQGQEWAQRRWGSGDSPPNGSPNGSPTGKGNGRGNGKAIAQTPDSRIQNLDSDSESDSEIQKNAGREDAGVPSEHSGATGAAPEREQRRALKRPELADQHLAEHLSRHGGMDGAAAWLLVATARDAAAPDHDQAARACAEYSQRHRLGWFAGEKVSLFAPARLRRRSPA